MNQKEKPEKPRADAAGGKEVEMKKDFVGSSRNLRSSVVYGCQVEVGINLIVHLLRKVVAKLREALEDRLSEILLLLSLTWQHSATTSRLPKFCQSNNTSPDECQLKANPQKLTCRRNLPHLKHLSMAKVVYSCRWTLDVIDPEEVLARFPFVQKLVIREGNVSEFLTDFPRSQYLQSLSLVQLNLREVRKSLVASLERLRFLDLSHNRLRHISPEMIKAHPSLLKVVLIDNPWNCSSDLKWMLDKSINSKVAHKSLVQCGGNVFPGKPVHFVMSLIRRLEKDCPTHICHCTMTNIVWDRDQMYLIPVITVNCSNRGLTEFPKNLPANTTSLLLSGNNISSVVPVVQNKAYRNIADIYLDYNQVRSIDVLEGALWLKTFRVLSLRGNQLSQLPVYALDNAFEKNTNMAKVYLGSNPWKCDCLFVPEFQHLLIKYSSVIADKGDIRCSGEGEKENANRQVSGVSTKSVCQRETGGINPLDALSAVFASLIVLIVGKLVYDYWTFKRSGKLPWIVTKMP